MDHTNQQASHTLGTYQYDRLDARLREIRILELYPEEEKGPVTCKLVKFSLDNDPEYDALSYMWSHDSDSISIRLDDYGFPVTKALEHTLRGLRLATKIRRLWIDAICINQSDTTERSEQVALMKVIYSRASVVRVWIDIDIKSDSYMLAKLSELTSESTPEDLGDDCQIWTPMKDLFQNPYWERLWIQQELIFSKRFEVHCNHTVLPGDKLVLFQWLLVRKGIENRFYTSGPWSKYVEELDLVTIPAKYLLWWQKMMELQEPVESLSLLPPRLMGRDFKDWKTSADALVTPVFLLGVLRNTQRLKVTDPRDRLYASLHLATDCDPGDFVIDYEKSLSEIFTEIAVFIARKHKSLMFLPQSGLRKEEDPRLVNMPSWVPNWDCRGGALFFWMAKFAAGPLEISRNIYQMPAKGIGPEQGLRVRGFRLENIVYVAPVDDLYFAPIRVLRDLVLAALKAPQDVFKIVCALMQALTGPTYMAIIQSSSKMTRGEEFLYMAILLRFSCVQNIRMVDFEAIPRESNDEIDTILQRLHQLRGLEESYLGGIDFDVLRKDKEYFDYDYRNYNAFIRCASRTMLASSLGLTDKDRFVVMQRHAPIQEGDQVWLLFGCPTPMVLRKRELGYTVVSPAYIHDIMQGEAVAGLPDEVQDGMLFGDEGFQITSIDLF